MLLQQGPVLLTNLSSSDVANPSSNHDWHFWLYSSVVCSTTSVAHPCSHCRCSRAANTDLVLLISLIKGFNSKNPDQRWAWYLLAEMKHGRGFVKIKLLPAVSCYQMQASPSPPPEETSAHCRPKQRSLDGIHVLLMRGLENLITPGLGFSVKHSHSLQLSGFSRRNVGGWFPHRVSSDFHKSFLPHFPFLEPFYLSSFSLCLSFCLYVCGLCYILITEVPFSFMYPTERTSNLPSWGGEECKDEQAALKDVRVCLT